MRLDLLAAQLYIICPNCHFFLSFQSRPLTSYRTACVKTGRPSDHEEILYKYLCIYLFIYSLIRPLIALLVGRSRDRFPVVSLGIFSVAPPPTEPCVLGSTQPLKMSTRDFSWGKGGRCVWLTTYHPRNAERQANLGLNLSGTPWATSACCGTTFTYSPFSFLHPYFSFVFLISYSY